VTGALKKTVEANISQATLASAQTSPASSALLDLALAECQKKRLS
jgi:hypothetical protein